MLFVIKLYITTKKSKQSVFLLSAVKNACDILCLLKNFCWHKSHVLSQFHDAET